MGAVDNTSFGNLLKTLFPDERVVNEAMLNKKWLSRCKKKGGFGGDSMKVPVDTGNPQGRSATFLKAKTNRSASTNYRWTITRAKDYGFIEYDGETLAASEGHENAFVEAVEHDGKMLIDELSKSLQIALYGTGSGSIGQVAAGGISAAVVTLTNKYDTLKFGKNMVVAFDTVDGGGTINSGTLTVLKKDFSAGTVTFTQNVTVGIASAAPGDFIFVDGDYDLKVKGLEGWLPQTVTSTSWFGVDRTEDPEALAGWRITDNTIPLEESFLTMISRLTMAGGSPNLALMTPATLADLVKGLSSKIMRKGDGGPMAIGASKVVAMLDGAEVELVSDTLCPANRVFVLQEDTWTFHHLRALPHIVADDGKQSDRMADSDGVEMRCRYFGQLVCRAPIRNGTINVPIAA